MKKKMALLALAATAWLGTTANTPVTRSVENPFIESTNTMTLDISDDSAESVPCVAL